MSLFSIRYPGKLAQKLALYIVVFSSALALVVISAEVSIEYLRDLRGIDQRMVQIEESYLPSIVENLWVTDHERLATQLAGIVRLPDFVMAEVRVGGKSLLRSGRNLEGAGTTRTFQLRHRHRDKDLLIGEMIVAASYQALYERTFDRLLVTIGASTIKTFFVVLFVFAVFYRLIGQHVEAVSRYAGGIGNTRTGGPLRLQRKEPSERDELSDLVDSLNAMRDRLGRQQEALARQIEEQRIATKVFESQEGVMITDADGVILRVNQALAEASGYTSEELVGQTPRLLRSGRHDAEFYRLMWQSLARTGAWQGEIWDRRKNGEVYPKWLAISTVKDAEGQVTHYIGTHYDVTERKKAEEQINSLAFYDQLTGLPNRTLLLDRLNRAMVSAARLGSHGALLLLDIDNFKVLNDTQGHEVGDLLLKQIAARLDQGIREEDTAARQGGDEFVVLLSGLGEDEHDAANVVESLGEKLLAELRRPYLLGDMVHHSSASIGITLFRDNVTTVDELMKQADMAMYRAKSAGRNTMRFFDPAMEMAVRARAELETDLRHAVEERQFLLHYQPQVVASGRVTGAEVLVRWQHPRRGMVSPAEFIPLAEETDLILPLGQWVLETACASLARWSSEPAMAELSVAVNVSARQFRQHDFVERVQLAIRKTGANPHRLKLELTESLLVDDVEEIIEKMHILKAKGIGFSMDDFGTGYSSLSYLKRLPLDQLKIDQSFVRDVLTDPNDAAIAKTVVALGQGLGLAVIAEGVETLAQRDFLASVGCHAYQGYYFAKPMAVDEFERLVGQS